MEKCFDGMTVLLPGFVNCGVSETLIDGLMKKGVKDLNIISNNTSIKGQGIGRLVHDNRIKHITCSHIGNNTETVEKVVAARSTSPSCPRAPSARRPGPAAPASAAS